MQRTAPAHQKRIRRRSFPPLLCLLESPEESSEEESSPEGQSTYSHSIPLRSQE